MPESSIPGADVGRDEWGGPSPAGRYMQDAAHAFADIRNYFQTHDARQMKLDLEARVRKNPLAAVAVSVGVGYLLGKILR